MASKASSLFLSPPTGPSMPLEVPKAFGLEARVPLVSRLLAAPLVLGVCPLVLVVAPATLVVRGLVVVVPPPGGGLGGAAPSFQLYRVVFLLAAASTAQTIASSPVAFLSESPGIVTFQVALVFTPVISMLIIVA